MYQDIYSKAMDMIRELKKRYPEESDFGEEIDHRFESAIASVYQTFDGQDLIPNVEDKASKLVELIISTHSFISGNHRIASLIDRWLKKQ